MALTNSNISYTGHVEKYIGTAYDKMAVISENLEELLKIYESIEDGSLNDILEIADDIGRVVEDINGFNGIYWGAIDTTDPSVILEDPNAPLAEQHPRFDANGDEANPGDLYYNLPRAEMYVRAEDHWSGTGTIERILERQVISAEQALGNVTGAIVLNLDAPYVMGAHNLLIFKDGILLSNTGLEPVTGDYQEVTPHQVSFPMPDGTNGLVGLLEGEEITFGINSDVSTLKTLVDVDQWIVAGGATKYEYYLPDNELYVPGDNNLEVYLGVNRILQIVDIDYTEPGPDHIRFIAAKNSEQVLFKRGNIISTVPSLGGTIFRDVKPDESLYEQGQQWFDTSRGRVYILYTDIDTSQWVSMSAEEDILIDGQNPIAPETPPVEQVRETIMQELQPDPSVYNKGALWFQTSTGKLFILYDDNDDAGTVGTDKHWVRVST